MFELDNQSKTFGVTVIENLFITEYLPSAKGDHVRVYLCLLYHCQQSDKTFGIEELATELGMTAAAVEASLRFWERRRLIERFSDSPPSYRLYHLGQRLLTGQDMQGGDLDYISFAEAVYALFGDERKVRPSDISSAYEWVSEIGLTKDAVIMLLNYLKDTRGKNFSFKAAESLAVQMKEAGVSSLEESEDFLNHSRQVHDGTRAVLRRFNFRRLPTEDELKLYRKWTEEWLFTQDGILAACAETVKAATPSFGYLNAILEGLKRRGSGTDAKQVQAHISKDSESLTGAREVLNALGLRTNATTILKAYENLLTLAPHDMIVLAAREVALRRGRFEDIETMLKTWKDKGLTNKEAIEKALPQLAQAAGKRPSKTVAAQQYQQRSYSEDELSGSVADMLKEAEKYDQP